MILPDIVIKDTMESDIVIVDTEETNALIRDIMEKVVLAEETKHSVFNIYTNIVEGIFLQCYYTTQNLSKIEPVGLG
jgi:hypothetical protein